MSQLTGQSFTGNSRGVSTAETFHATNPATGESLQPGFHKASAGEVQRAGDLAGTAFREYRLKSDGQRADFLRAVAAEIDAIGDQITARGCEETGLPAARLNGERGRTRGLAGLPRRTAARGT